MTVKRWIGGFILPGLAVPLALVGWWWGASHAHPVAGALLPSPAKVWQTSIELLHDKVLLPSLGLSIALVGYGFLTGALAGFVLGTAMGISKTLERLYLPLFNGIRQVPLVAWVPLIVIWFGIGEISKIVLIALGASYPVALNTFAGIRSVPRDFVDVANVFEYGRLGIWWRVLLPAALPSILTGIRLSLSKSWTMVIGAEALMTTVSSGIGNLMLEGGEQGRMDIVIVSIIVVGVVGFVMNQAVRVIELRLLRWNKGLA
ncbi:MAG TPA: ABC transporter permease [Steroidobacteraceae bacterium]|nr:ABC transporter permease [Steroidobacteraceae bacterium]